MGWMLTGGFGGPGGALIIRGFGAFSPAVVLAASDEYPPPYRGTRAAGDSLTLLEEIVVNSLFADRRASPGDDLPGDPDDLRGWWADAHATDGDPFGSRLWLLERSTTSAVTVQAVQEYAAEALAWMIEDGVAQSVECAADRVALDAIGLIVVITEPDGAETTIRFPNVWT